MKKYERSILNLQIIPQIFNLVFVAFFISVAAPAWGLESEVKATSPIATETSPTAEPPAPELSFEEAFKKGLDAYKAKKFAEATATFEQALKKQPNNVSTMTNLALAEFQLGHKARSVALLRRALNIDPDFSVPAAGLKFILPQLEVKEIPHEIQLHESLRSELLTPVPWTVYLGLTAFFLLAGGWLMIGYWGARRRAFLNETPLPSFPNIGFLFVLAFILFSSLSIAKFLDYQVPRGTVVADKVIVMSAPDSQSASLFDLYGGLEVIIENMNAEWVQVTYPGALSGWIPKNAVLPTSGKILW